METITRNLVQGMLCSLAILLGLLVSVASANDKLTSESVDRLIEDLVLTEKDTFVMDGRSYLGREGADRINQAAAQLKNAGKNAWPQLFAHLRDKRESTPSASTLGPYDVGQKCHYILRFQIMDFPKGYPYSKLLAYHQISFRPGIDAWLTQRKDRSLDEIRYEVLAILIDMEAYVRNQKAVDLLEPHLATIDERIKAAARPIAIRATISYGDERVDGVVNFDNGVAPGKRRIHFTKCIGELKVQLDSSPAKVLLTVKAGKRDLPWEREFFGLMKELEKNGRLEMTFKPATSATQPSGPH